MACMTTGTEWGPHGGSLGSLQLDGSTHLCAREPGLGSSWLCLGFSTHWFAWEPGLGLDWSVAISAGSSTDWCRGQTEPKLPPTGIYRSKVWRHSSWSQGKKKHTQRNEVWSWNTCYKDWVTSVSDPHLSQHKASSASWIGENKDSLNNTSGQSLQRQAHRSMGTRR